LRRGKWIDLEFTEGKKAGFLLSISRVCWLENKQTFTFEATKLKALWENCLNKKYLLLFSKNRCKNIVVFTSFERNTFEISFKI
jgi:hypothetical protein